MQCLKDFIGLRWKNGEVPESNLYINDLPGISLKSIDKIANEDQITFFEVWETIQRRSLQRFTTDVQNRLGTRYRLRKLTESTAWIKQVDTERNQTAAASEYRGFDIQMGIPQLQITNIQGWVSPLQVINVQTLWIYLKADATIPLRFFSIVSNFATEITDARQDIVGTVGWNEIKVNRDFFDVPHLFIGYDASEIESVWLPLDWTFDFFYSSAFISIWDASSRIMGCKSSLTDTARLTYGNNTFGIVGQVSVRCKFEGLICKNKSVITTALWYLLGAELMAERIYSDRLNRYTTIDLERAGKLRAEFEARYYDELQAALDAIDLNINDPCTDCNGLVQLADNLP